MKKFSKKLISIVLCVLMAFSALTVSFAADDEFGLLPGQHQEGEFQDPEGETKIDPTDNNFLTVFAQFFAQIKDFLQSIVDGIMHMFETILGA